MTKTMLPHLSIERMTAGHARFTVDLETLLKPHDMLWEAEADRGKALN